MKKQSFLNGTLFLFSIFGAVLAFVFGEVLLRFIAFLPDWLQCGLYLMFVMFMCALTMIVSEKVKSGNYLMKHRKEFGMTVGKAMLIFLPMALVLGILTQFLYGWLIVAGAETPRFQGTMLVCDVSGSMTGNDPEQEMVAGMLSYVESAPLGENLGVMLFDHDVYTLREYSPLRDEAERDELLLEIEDIYRLIDEGVYYSGGTNINLALLEAIANMRENTQRADWPGLILFFSDGESYIDYDAIRRASEGDRENPKNIIPVNTIFYSPPHLNGSHMETVANITGGNYIHVRLGDDVNSLQDIFIESKRSFELESAHLIKSYTGLARYSPLRLILQGLFVMIWMVFAGVFVIVFLNNDNLFRHFFIPRIIVAAVIAVIFTAWILQTEDAVRTSGMISEAVDTFDSSLGSGSAFSATIDLGLESTLCRGLLAAGLCVLYLPTYRWD